MKFTKMQGLGNDYLYVCAQEAPENAAALSRRLSDRRFGVGADGMIWILPSTCADVRMRIFNADGSEAMMCGNGIRCVAKYAYEHGLCRKTQMTVETASGVRTLQLLLENGEVRAVRVEMGRAEVSDRILFEHAGRSFELYPVRVGNPHAVCFLPTFDERLLQAVGSALQSDPRFPGGVNLELAKCLTPELLYLCVWERGSGITLACGTGACASCAAAVAKGQCQVEQPITVRLDGGELTVTVRSDGSVLMRGPAEFVYEGEYTPC